MNDEELAKVLQEEEYERIQGKNELVHVPTGSQSLELTDPNPDARQLFRQVPRDILDR